MFKKIGVFFLGFFFACSTHSDFSKNPRERLKEYIAKSFSIKKPSDKQILMDYLIGDVKARLQSWSEDQFRDVFIDSKREFRSLSFKEVKVISNHEVGITYELSFMDEGKQSRREKHLARVTHKKLCQMILDKQNWFISEVRNLKELIEYENELALP